MSGWRMRRVSGGRAAARRCGGAPAPRRRGVRGRRGDALAASLLDLEERLHQERHTLRSAEAADRIALHLIPVIERPIATLDDKDRAQAGAEVARQLIRRLDELVAKADVAGDAPVPTAEILEAILGRNPDGSTKSIERPMIPLLDTTLLTNAPGEPRVGKQIETEIGSADRTSQVGKQTPSDRDQGMTVSRNWHAATRPESGPIREQSSRLG